MPKYIPKVNENICPCKTCMQMFIATLLMTAKKREQYKCPSLGKSINKMWNNYIMEYNLIIKRNEILIWYNKKNLQNMLSERSQSQSTAYCMIHLYEVSKKDKSVEIQSRLMVSNHSFCNLPLREQYYLYHFLGSGEIYSTQSISLFYFVC